MLKHLLTQTGNTLQTRTSHCAKLKRTIWQSVASQSHVACRRSPHFAAAERSCWDSWSWGKSSGPPLRESYWNWDPGGKSWVRVWTRQRRWSGGGLVRRDRPSWEVAQAGTRRHSCLWQTTSSSFNSNGQTGFSTADCWTRLNSSLPSLLYVPQQMASAPLFPCRKGPCPPHAGSLSPR